VLTLLFPFSALKCYCHSATIELRTSGLCRLRYPRLVDLLQAADPLIQEGPSVAQFCFQLIHHLLQPHNPNIAVFFHCVPKLARRTYILEASFGTQWKKTATVLIIYLLTPPIKSTFLWLWGVKPKMKTTPNDMTSITILVTIVRHTLSMCRGANVDSSSVLYSSSFHPLLILYSSLRAR
jgi:hypothetical protein